MILKKTKRDLARERLMSVYPGTWVDPIIMRSSLSYNQAIECFSVIIGPITVQVETMFTRSEWNFVWDCTENSIQTIRPIAGEPGLSLSQQVADAQAVRGVGSRHFGNRFRSRVEEVRAKLRSLGYLPAWAVILALQWRSKNPEITPEKDEWWTLAARQKGLKPSTTE